MSHDHSPAGAGAPENVRVRIRRLDHAEGVPLPAYESEGAAGMDARAAITAPIELAPGDIARVPTGFAIELPPGFELQIRPRSGLGTRHGVTLPNSPATIDSDYRGEIVIALINHGSSPFRIEPGMRIAQMVLARVPRVLWAEAKELGETSRGAGGFGHTGTA